MSQSKSEIRNQVRNLRKNQPVCTNFDFLFGVSEIESAEVIASYYPTEFEPNTISINELLLQKKKIVILPRIKNNELEFAQYNGNNLVDNGIFKEPTGLSFFGDIDVILTPAIAVDQSGVRLGQGGGFYDKFLRTTNAYRIAIINENEFKKTLPSEWHDQKVDAVALPSGLVRISQ